MDRIIATVAIAVLIAFMGVMIWFVARPNLIVITAIVLAMAIYDFWIQLFRRRSREG